MSRSTDCDTCSEWFNPVPFDEDQGENAEPIAFSRTPCQSPFECEQGHLAGERYVVHVMHHDRTLEHLEVCPECYPELAEMPPLPVCEDCAEGVGLAWLDHPTFTDHGPQCPDCAEVSA